MMVAVFLLVHLKSFLRVCLIMIHHHLAMRIFVRIPAFDVAFLVGDLMALLRVLVIA